MSFMSPIDPAQTILIVDDNPVNLAVVVDHLEEHGFNVTVAQGGEEALKRAAFSLPDLILLDVMMPGIDGFETCRRLKADKATSDIPVIFMTALSDFADKVSGFAAGAVDYVSKPFQIEELLARVRTHLALRAARLKMSEQNVELRAEIIARRSAETAMRFSEIRYKRLFEAANDGILLLDGDSKKVTDANPAMLAMLGNRREWLMGRTLDEIPAFSKIPASKPALAEFDLQRHHRHDDWALQRADGSTIDVELVGALYQADGVNIIQCNFRDITARREAEPRIRYMALHDALTGLPNRIMLADRLAQAIAQARRHSSQVAVLMLDLDHFKDINDSLGHHVGDQLLEAIAVRLRGSLRDSDTAARVGGDEFVIALSEIESEEDAVAVAQKVLAMLVEPFVIDQYSLHIGGSIGISMFPEDGADAGALLRAADTAMYDAKQNARGTHRFFTPALNEAAQRRHILANDVHLACARGEFTLQYQPQLALESGRITAVEALIRWNHPEHGMIAPTLFVPLLEELGLMVEVGEWVLDTACRQNAEWQAEGLPPVRMAVNLSAQQFYRGDIVQSIQRALDNTGLDAKWLERELTESLTLDDTETTIQTMRRLKALGVSLSLDDFGTGWSSLAYVRRFPLDRIKIDRSFMRDVTTHPNAAAVVQSILHLAQSLGLGCIAEGVETPAQLDYLEQQHCEEIQGFLLSEALPAEDMPDMLSALHPLSELRELVLTTRIPVMAGA